MPLNLIYSLLFCLATPAESLPFSLGAGQSLQVVTHENPHAENTLDFLLNGKLVQSEKQLGDQFKALEFKGHKASAQLLEIGGHQEILVRLLMVPMGVVRVFRWDPAQSHFTRAKFGKKREDGLPVPPNGIVELRANGDLEFTRSGRRYTLARQGDEYALPARLATK